MNSPVFFFGLKKIQSTSSPASLTYIQTAVDFKTLPSGCSLLLDRFLILVVKCKMWKIGSPRLSGRCLPSADMQKLRLTLFWTEREGGAGWGEDKDMMREAYSFMAEAQNKYTVRTRHLTCPHLFSRAPLSLASAPYMVHVTRHGP